MPRKLGEDFYADHAVTIASQLIGCLLCRRLDGQICKYPITETEAYYGEDDTACHAHKGKTPRTKTMYEQGGVAYIYLCYGIHHLLNVVTGPADFPAAVLIRGIQGFNGPGKLTKALQITKDLNGLSLIHSDELWLEDRVEKPPFIARPRVGIDYAALEDRQKPWRFTAINPLD